MAQGGISFAKAGNKRVFYNCIRILTLGHPKREYILITDNRAQGYIRCSADIADRYLRPCRKIISNEGIERLCVHGFCEHNELADLFFRCCAVLCFFSQSVKSFEIALLAARYFNCLTVFSELILRIELTKFFTKALDILRPAINLLTIDFCLGISALSIRCIMQCRRNALRTKSRKNSGCSCKGHVLAFVHKGLLVSFYITHTH